jgi:hypothetical protein
MAVGYANVNVYFSRGMVDEQKSSLEMYLLHLHGSETIASANFTFPRIYHSFLVLTIDVQLPSGWSPSTIPCQDQRSFISYSVQLPVTTATFDHEEAPFYLS